MGDYKKYIFPLLKGKKPDDPSFSRDYLKFKYSIKKLIKKTFSYAFTPQIEALFKKAYGEDYLEDLFQEFLLRLVQNREIVLQLEFINERYLLSIIQNIIYYHLSSGFRLIEKQISFEELNPDPEKEEKVKAEEKIAPQAYDYLKKLKITHWLNELQIKLDEKDEEAFCYYLFKILLKKEMELKSLSKTALYKRWERLKTKLRNILGTYLEEKDFEELKELFEIYLSEICKTRYSIKK